MPSRQRQGLGLALLAALVLVGVVYRSTFAAIVQKWSDDAAFSHGFLIVPIAVWLAWQKRAELAAVTWRPSWLGAIAIAAAMAAWVVARGTGVLVLEQLATVAMIPAMVLAVLGWRAAWALAFPLAFLFFAVPFGRGLVPWFMQVTADMATWTLQLSGVPIFRSHMYISIPSGDFEVARACSGLNYVITGLVLGVLYAHLTYTRWTKRVLCVLAFLVIPILANGLRVYLTIAVSHLTDMRWGPGTEHVTLGRILFIVVMTLMFWVGRRWHDDHVATSPGPVQPSQPLSATAWLPVPVALVLALIGPPYLASVAGGSVRLDDASELAVLPNAAPGWQGPSADPSAWRPLYVDPLEEHSGVYRDAAGVAVDVYVGVYGLGSTAGSEMISFRNRITYTEGESLAAESKRRVAGEEGRTFEVRERVVRRAGEDLLVWHWFMVGPWHATSEFAVKGLEALAFVTGRVEPERILSLATPMDEDAADRLAAFAAAHEACVASGFDPRACPP